MKKLLVTLLILSFGTTYAADENSGLLKDFDSLGGNDVLLDKAQALNPEVSVKIVQKRIVDRHFRNEFSPEVGIALGGDTYVDTQTVGLGYQFHINPRWSVGVKYNHFFNQLSEEGENLLNERIENGNVVIDIPEMDYMKSMYLATVNFYPIYGKFNFLDQGVVHFDTYLVLGGGQAELKNGDSPVYTAGLGFGLWFSQHLTSRMEIRYQNHEVQWYNGTQNIDTTIASFSMGYLL